MLWLRAKNWVGEGKRSSSREVGWRRASSGVISSEMNTDGGWVKG